jgi:branched-chain amino acid aminotransferase
LPVHNGIDLLIFADLLTQATKMKEIQGRSFLINNFLRSTSRFNPLFLEKGTNLYEVVRVIRGRVLFLEDHFNRVKKSAERLRLKVWYDEKMLRENLRILINANKLQFGNIKFVFHFENEKNNNYFFAYQLPYKYPSPDEYNFGVNLLTYQYQRPDPGVKNWLPSFKAEISELKEKNDVYEILLVNDEGIVTEGSQSNFFLIKGNTIITPPKDLILPGVTRNYIFSICKEHNIQIKEETFRAHELFSAQSAFITGTSPKILPVSEIDGEKFLVRNHILQKLISAYEKIIEEYISRSIHYDH